MVASTRFRRLFASKGGFTLFMQVLFKTYAEAENHSGIRHAIVYAVHRFFAQHGENFVFQSIDTLAHILMVPNVDGDWIAKNVFSLFSTLKSKLSTSAPDAAGIRNANKEQEREALMVRTAEEKPQTYLGSLRQTGNNGEGLTVPPQEYEAKPLRSDDFVRLFLTVIAHDPTILRAENFLRLFRFLTPYFYHASGNARDVLRDGIDALGLVLLKTFGRARPHRAIVDTADGDPNVQPSEAMLLETNPLDDPKSASDLCSMRMDYLSMVVDFTRSGGQLQPVSSRRVLDVVKLILKDPSDERKDAISSFLTEYAKASLSRTDHSSPKDSLPFLSEMATLIPLHIFDIDFSGMFDAVSAIVTNPHFANEPQFPHMVVSQLCGGALNACESASTSWPFSSSPVRLSLVSLIAKAIYLRGVDPIGEVEKIPTSVDFLTGIILPLVLTLKSSMDAASDDLQMEFRQRSILTKTWVRLLYYVMSASRKSTPSDDRSKLADRHQPSSRKAQVHLRTMVVQIVKIIIIRAESDLSSNFPGIWCRVASFLDTLIGDGSASFAVQSQDPYYSPSPTQSPRTSGVQFGSLDPATSLGEFGFRRLSHGPGSPRLVDYSMWSLFELLCQCRHPLLLQMRLSMRVKVAALDQSLQSSQHSTSLGHGGRRISTAFSKPRLSSSPSLSLSPESSYRVSSSPPYQHSPGFRQFPSPPTTSRQDSYGIVDTPTISSPRRSGDSGDSGRRSVGLGRYPFVRSPSLVRATYRRIRLVQSCLGYDILVPLPEGEPDGGMEHLATSWTRKQALDAIVQETQELVEEFREFVPLENQDGVLVDPNLSLAI